MGLAGVIHELLAFIGGPIGIFLISLVSNSIPFIVIPYLGVVAGYSFIYVSLPSRLLLITVSAAGASIGKVIVYFLGSAFRFKLSESSRRNVELFKRLARRSLFIAILVFASTPLPDDVLYIPLGLMRYPLPQYLLAVFAGKIILTSVVVLYASWITLVATTQVYTVPALIALTVFLAIVMLRVDWYEVINALYNKGIMAGWGEFVNQFLKVVRELLSRRGSSRGVPNNN